ncbi:MAG: hypothetical protein A2138_12195 [Deltaproteobacteria bacterium RBG_16_71_12]|nr:MAG: hypothetical protein A2138_12195 [Deltaproteobacteria bacterium RBG_16_71_12]
MRKTTVYLDDESLRALKRLARELRRPEAELVREAICRFASSAGRPASKSLGAVAGPGNLAQRVGELLDEGFGTDDAHR